MNFSRVLLTASAGVLVLSSCGSPSPAIVSDRDAQSDEALYRTRFERLRDRTGASGLPSYDILKRVEGAAHKPLEVSERPVISAAAIESAIEYAASMNSRALLIWQGDALVAARYFDAADEDTLLVSRSLAKPLGVIAVGRAIQRGFIGSVVDPVSRYIGEWRNTDRQSIQIRHLLDMRSGLLPQGAAESIDDVLNRAYLHPRHDEVIINEYPLTHEPGSRYEYSNANSELIAPLIERATGVQYEDWIADEVLKPIGAAGGEVWMNREGGTAHSGCCWLLPAETYLRLALLLLDDGVADGRRLLPAGFVADITTATAENRHAGMGVYVAGDYVERRGPLNPEMTIGQVLHGEPYLADDLYLFDGNSNQVVYIVPSLSMVIVRLGNRPQTGEWDNAFLPNLLIRGMPESLRRQANPQPGTPSR